MSPTVTGMRGTQSPFRPKDPSTRIQGILTKDGKRFFEQHRKKLHRLLETATRAKWPRPSDADTVEYLARGAIGTLKHLEAIGLTYGEKKNGPPSSDGKTARTGGLEPVANLLEPGQSTPGGRRWRRSGRP